uniref:ATP synthase F0 subunit b n=1 Tax=Ancoracysta twista TaxID=2044563 RepID=A0A2H4R8F8_9EUKA|nr:ATP synthase F0 subunit b [Ancoracysta twista]ATY40935.1 ATP synthase F0 subunit b [Ancoracysta twista]
MQSAIQRNRNILAVFLVLFLIASLSKEIILLNEETLVGICFILFVLYTNKYFSASVANSLDEVAANIEKEFSNYFSVYKKTLELLITYHRRKLDLYVTMESVFSWAKSEVAEIVTARNLALQQELTSQLQNRLNRILMKESDFIQEIYMKNLNLFTKSLELKILANNSKNSELASLNEDQKTNNFIEKVSTININF